VTPVKKNAPKITPKVKPQPPPVANVAKAGVEFRVRPFGAVWVDGNYLGETPFAPAQLGVGMHSVRVVNRDLNKEVTKQFEVKDGSNVFRHNFEE
jgi:serine/threonine-protein kinase